MEQQEGLFEWYVWMYTCVQIHKLEASLRDIVSKY